MDTMKIDPQGALVFTDFQWEIFHLDEKSTVRQLELGLAAPHCIAVNLRAAGYTATC